MDVAAWLSGLGLERYEQAFRDNAIDGEILPELTEADLEKLGVVLGHRKRLLKAIAALRAPSAGPPSEPLPAPDPARVPGGPGEPTAERRQLTVMFVDLVGSTALAARLDPEDMSEVLRAYQRRVAEVIGRFEGHVAKYLGDGVLAYFGYPRAHEDDAERAVRAGLAITGAVEALRLPLGGPLAARVGIATGLVIVGDLVGDGAAQERAVVGETPNLAARLQALAEAGSVVIAPTTRRLLGRLFALADIGVHNLKGFDEPVRAWRVVGEGRAEGRFEALHDGNRLTPLVGREEEIALLRQRWALAKGGEGQVALLSGEPGVGKSRLLRTLRERLARECHTPLGHYCSPYHTQSALHPVIGLLERAAGLRRDDPPERQLDALEALLALAAEEVREVAPLLADLLAIPTGGRYPLLDLSPQRKKEKTFQALLDQLAGLAAKQPVLALYEDVHWADPSTLELLGLLVERVQRLPALVVITFRPEFTPPWTGHGHVTALSLSRLGRRQGVTLVERVTGGERLPAQVAEQIVAKADGVPLFVEELTKAVLETGAPGSGTAVPASLHASLMARLDRVPGTKEVAQVAACIGREFAYPLLAAVCPTPEPDLRAALDRLATAELVFRRGAPPEASYSFKHALIRDVAYESLLKARRREVHARIADALAEVGDAPPELVALHSARAGRMRDAVALWIEAARRASARSAVHEAIAHLRSALRRLAELPAGAERDALALQAHLGLGQGLLAARSWADPEAGEHFAAAGDLAHRAGSPEQRAAGLFGAFQHHLNRQEFDLAQPLADELRRLADAADDDAARVAGHRSLGVLLYFTGRPALAERHLRCAIERHNPVRHGGLPQRYGFELRSGAMAPLAMSLVSRGMVREGLALADEALAYAAGLPYRHSWCHTACLAAYALHFARADARFAALAERFTSVAADQGFAYLQARGEILVGLARVRSGERDAGLEVLRRGMAGVAATGTRLGRSYDQAMLAEALLAADEPASAREAADEGIATAYERGEHLVTPMLLTLRAQAVCAASEAERAPQDLERAVAEAGKRGMRLFELRAACHLARLLTEGGERRKAHDLLAPIYGWFSEGFDTPDLRDAKALLDELG